MSCPLRLVSGVGHGCRMRVDAVPGQFPQYRGRLPLPLEPGSVDHCRLENVPLFVLEAQPADASHAPQFLHLSPYFF